VKRQGTNCRKNIASLIRLLKEPLEEITEFSLNGTESPRICREGRTVQHLKEND
jgi:hypothetical protein